MKKIHYDSIGICATAIDVVLNDDDTVESVVFTGGCPGNHLGIAALVKGMKREEVIKRLGGIICGNKASSCPDQLAKALATVR
ncbi:MAG: TIGR03905 family TSCPD domain-containing protein [Victivallales bacterium]|nr:TIGR03905 family TSCPD domain-containing protein [Victivallales bacterium]